jgi:hypothetical protein
VKPGHTWLSLALVSKFDLRLPCFAFFFLLYSLPQRSLGSIRSPCFHVSVGLVLDFKSTLALEGALQLPSLLNNYIADSYQNQMPGLI